MSFVDFREQDQQEEFKNVIHEGGLRDDHVATTAHAD